MDNFLWSITPPDFMFLQRPRRSGIGGDVSFFHLTLLYTAQNRISFLSVILEHSDVN